MLRGEVSPLFFAKKNAQQHNSHRLNIFQRSFKPLKKAEKHGLSQLLLLPKTLFNRNKFY